MLLSAIYNLPLHEFSPRRIKQALTGNGNSTKEQVQFMVKKIKSAAVAEGDFFCNKCGNKQPESDSRFCSKCGNPLQPPIESTT